MGLLVMMRKVLALLVSGMIGLGGGLGGMNASWAQGAPEQGKNASWAQGAPEQGKSVSAIGVAVNAKPANSAPLAAGGAAGIRQAQGTGERIWNIVGIGLIAGVGLAMILIDGDDPKSPSTGTN